MTIDNPSYRKDEEVLRAAEARASHSNEHQSLKLEGVVVGRLIGFSEEGAPLVEFSGAEAEEPAEARTTVPLNLDQVDSEVTLVFEGADPRLPIIMGVIREALPGAARLDIGKLLSADADGQRVLLTAEKEIELRCGKATIVLTRAGKILVSGTYLSSRSTGVHRVKGGSVQIN